jgi:hypothetical protein
MFIDSMPIWGVFLGAIVVVMGAIEIGYRLGSAALRWSAGEKESPASAIAGAVLGLAAFMLAFTFGMVSERHDAKKALVREDAIAIRTAWQRADLLPQPDRAEAKDMLRQYLDSRLSFAEVHSLEQGRVQSMLSETQRTQDRLWDMAVANTRKDMNSDYASLYIESLNAVNAINASRLAIGVQARIPIEVWLTLCCITILGMVGVGYHTAVAESKRSMASPILALAFALVIALIISIDRPDSGVMAVTQQPLIDLRDSMAITAGHR